MIFTSFEFILFFALVLSVRSCLRSFNAEKWFLLAASYIFYMSWSVPCGFLILATSLTDYFVGVGLGRIENERKRKCLLAVSIVANLGVLGFFKYTNFFLANLASGVDLFGFHVSQRHLDIILPAGISFFTFQSMTYTIETYRRNIKPCHSLRDFLLFVAFFPQLLAGPINRAANLLPQFAQRVRASVQQFESGLAQFAMGAVKKIVISDQISPHVDMIFAAPGNYDAVTLLQGVLGYAVQIYCDFSGYSDMAIGCARMMGFHFPENFQMPYSSLSITEFWRRWHISLSSWFRDYLYIPLGGNRKGTARTYANLLSTMLLCGLWHGANWNFVFWGGLHGASLAVHRAWKNWNPLAGLDKYSLFRLAWSLFARLLTLFVVLVGWIFFREHSWIVGWQYLGRIVTWNHSGVRFMSPYILAAVGVVFLAHVVVPKDFNWFEDISKRPVLARAVGYGALLFFIVAFGATDASPFIYFQF
ncbi:MAG TPA: MBOAT family O-acyltransferase [Verrucomicrobiae bacterium]|nr:MBOAT family O-acyltransferase [Verrucomicrobiae bacterium]